MQALIWLTLPLKTNAGAKDVIAANVVCTEGSVDNMAVIEHSAGRVRVQYAHILEKEDVTNDLWLVEGMDTFHDLRGQ